MGSGTFRVRKSPKSKNLVSILYTLRAVEISFTVVIPTFYIARDMAHNPQFTSTVHLVMFATIEHRSQPVASE